MGKSETGTDAEAKTKAQGRARSHKPVRGQTEGGATKAEVGQRCGELVSDNGRVKFPGEGVTGGRESC